GNVDVGRAGRDGLETAEHGQAVAGGDLAGRGESEGAVTGVGGGAVGALHFEEAVALDGEVEPLAGGVDLALGENLGGGGDAGAVADLDAGGHEVAAAGLGAGRARTLVEQILELDLAALEAGGVHVRQVVGDRVQV